MWRGVEESGEGWEERRERWEERREQVEEKYKLLRESKPELPPRLRPFQVSFL